MGERDRDRLFLACQRQSVQGETAGDRSSSARQLSGKKPRDKLFPSNYPIVRSRSSLGEEIEISLLFLEVYKIGLGIVYTGAAVDKSSFVIVTFALELARVIVVSQTSEVHSLRALKPTALYLTNPGVGKDDYVANNTP